MLLKSLFVMFMLTISMNVASTEHSVTQDLLGDFIHCIDQSEVADDCLPPSSAYSSSQLEYVKKYTSADAADNILTNVYKVAEEFKVSPRLLIAIATKESSFNPRARSRDGSKGLIQVREKVHRKLIASLGVKNIYDVHGNLRVGSSIFTSCLKRANGDVFTALKMYSGGSAKYARSVLNIQRLVPA